MYFHSAADDPEKRRKFKCEICGMALTSMSILTTHKEIHLGNLNSICSSSKFDVRVQCAEWLFIKMMLRRRNSNVKFAESHLGNSEISTNTS